MADQAPLPDPIRERLESIDSKLDALAAQGQQFEQMLGLLIQALDQVARNGAAALN